VDLRPDREADERDEEEQRPDEDEEANARVPELVPMLGPGAAARPGPAKLALDGKGVDGGLVGRPGDARLVDTRTSGRRRGHGTRFLPLARRSASGDPSYRRKLRTR